jgi:hypothetical protein
VKIIFRNDDGSIKATAIYGLGEIECQKDTAELLALAFTPMLNAALKRIVSYVRSDDGQLISDGTLAVYNKKENLPRQGPERETEEAGKGTRKEQKAKLHLIQTSTKEQKVTQKPMPSSQLQRSMPSWTEQAG